MPSEKTRILISAPYLLPFMSRFEKYFEAQGWEVILAEVVERLEADDLLNYAGQIDGVICGDDRFTAKVLEAAAPRLKVISKWGTGIDSIDVEAAEALDIAVCNTPEAFTDPVADTVMGYLLAFARRGPWMDQAMKSGQWEKIPGFALNEAVLGVIGVGSIGSAVLRRAKAFNLRLLGNDIRTIDSSLVDELGVEMLPLDDLLAGSTFVSLNCDLNPSSHHLINAKTIKSMRLGSYLINTSRGPVVNQTALIDALQSGHLAGAALDVFEHEPLPADSPLRDMDQVLLAPHNANSSPKAWERVHRNTLANLFTKLGAPAPDFGKE
jgi:phosphoglycerate dehydrogenase-like enzyme